MRYETDSNVPAPTNINASQKPKTLRGVRVLATAGFALVRLCWFRPFSLLSALLGLLVVPAVLHWL